MCGPSDTGVPKNPKMEAPGQISPLFLRMPHEILAHFFFPSIYRFLEPRSWKAQDCCLNSYFHGGTTLENLLLTEPFFMDHPRHLRWQMANPQVDQNSKPISPDLGIISRAIPFGLNCKYGSF